MIKDLKISNEDIARYQTDGAVLIKGALVADDLRLLEMGIEEVHRAPGRHSKISDATGVGETMVAEYVSRHSSALRTLLENGAIGQLAGKLMQAPSAQLILDQIFYKSKGPIVPTPWHQDTPFLRVRGDDMIRVWIPCDYSPRALTVQVVRGSHRWNVVYNTMSERPSPIAVVGAAKGVTHSGVGDATLPPPPDVARYRGSFDIMSWDVEPGDAVVFQGNMLHGADGDPAYDRPRRALAWMLGGPKLQYHVPKGKAFPVPGTLNGETIPDGAPIGAYENAFPVCWRAAA